MLMDAMPAAAASTTGFKAPPLKNVVAAAAAAFGHLLPPQQPPAAGGGGGAVVESVQMPMLHFPDFFLSEPTSDGLIATNGFRDVVAAVKFDASSLVAQQQQQQQTMMMMLDAAKIEMVLPARSREDGAAMKPVELKTKIKEESNGHGHGNRSATVKTGGGGGRSSVREREEKRDSVDLIDGLEKKPVGRGEESPSSMRGRTSFAEPSESEAAGAVAQAPSLLWPTDLSQGHQQLALNCR